MRGLLNLVVALFVLLSFQVEAHAVKTIVYGNMKYATTYAKTDGQNLMNLQDFNSASGDDWAWKHDMIITSKFGAIIQHENIKGVVEAGVAGDNFVDKFGFRYREDYGSWYVRKAVGFYTFGNGLELKIGHDYSPIKFIYTGMAVNDAGSQGLGNVYLDRVDQIGINYKGFSFSLIDVTSNGDLGTKDIYNTFKDMDRTFPKIEFSYTKRHKSFSYEFGAGFQTYKLQTTKGNDDVTSWVVAGDIKKSWGPFGMWIGGSIGQNMVQYGAFVIPGTRSALWDPINNEVDDNISYGGCFTLNYKFGKKLRSFFGIDYIGDQNDLEGFDNKSEYWAVHLNLMISPITNSLFAYPHFYVVPEIGYIDNGESKTGEDRGELYYTGILWQIRF
jgi:hypothetical protein